jgi:hypothetical protein
LGIHPEVYLLLQLPLMLSRLMHCMLRTLMYNNILLPTCPALPVFPLQPPSVPADWKLLRCPLLMILSSHLLHLILHLCFLHWLATLHWLPMLPLKCRS